MSAVDAKSNTAKGSTEKISHPDKVGRLTSVEDTINII